MSDLPKKIATATVGTKIETTLKIDGKGVSNVTLHCTEATTSTRRFAVFHKTGAKLMDVKSELVKGKWVPA